MPGRGYDVVFPFIKLPDLTPNLNGDRVQFGSPELEPNRLYYGDDLQVLRTLPSNSIDLIYIDPPFFSGADYNVIRGDTNEVCTFSDIWEGRLDTYLIWLNARLWEMRRVNASSIQAKLDLPEGKSAIPDIRVHYVGVYPMDRFKAVDQPEFERFVLTCLAAQSDNSERPISGHRSGREPLRMGPADPDA